MTRPATNATDFFMALTNEAPERRDGLRLWFVNDTDAAVTLRLRSSAVLDLNTGPMRLGADERPAWEDLGEIPPRSACTVSEGLSPSADVIVYYDVEVATPSGLTEWKFSVVLDTPTYSKPERLPLLAREGYPFPPEKVYPPQEPINPWA